MGKHVSRNVLSPLRFPMLTCLPQSLCSWDYRILDAAGGPGSIDFNFFTEQGCIYFGAHELAVRKQGPLSGHWTLEHENRMIAEARKPNPLFRSFDLDVNGTCFTVKAISPFGRGYEIVSAGHAVGSISPVHPFTRRAVIDCGGGIPELGQLFAFWLVVLTWRRKARESN